MRFTVCIEDTVDQGQSENPSWSVGKIKRYILATVRSSREPGGHIKWQLQAHVHVSFFVSVLNFPPYSNMFIKPKILTDSYLS